MLQRRQKPEEEWLVCIQSQEAERDEQAVSSLSPSHSVWDVSLQSDATIIRMDLPSSVNLI